MAAFLNRCVWTAAAGGLTDFVVAASAQNGYIPDDCLDPVVVDAETYHYFATNGAEHEEGDGVYDVATSTLTRATIRNSSNAGSAVDFTAAPVVTMGGPIATDIPSAFRTLLTADRTYYVDEATGSNSNDGSSGAPWATLQHAMDIVGTLDFAIYGIDILIQPGTYEGFIVPPLVGGNNNVYVSSSDYDPATTYPFGLRIKGTQGDPTQVTIIENATSQIFVYGPNVGSSVMVLIENVTFDGTDMVSNNAIIYWAAPGSQLFLGYYEGAINFKNILRGDLISAVTGSLITSYAPIYIDASGFGPLDFLLVSRQGAEIALACPFTITGDLTVNGQFAFAGDGGRIENYYGTSFDVSGGSVTGRRFWADSGGVINTIGDFKTSAAADMNFFPGTVSGVQAAGGIYAGAVYTVADLPTSVGGLGPIEGQMESVSDGDSGLAWGDVVVNSGAGATPYRVWFNGTDWTVIGK